MINLLPILQEIETLIAQVKRWGEFDGGEESATWTFGEFHVLEHNCLGTALYINDVQVWNNW